MNGGGVLHVDGFVVAGRPEVWVGSRYLNTPRDFAAGKPLGSVQIGPPPGCEQWVAQALAAAGIRSGAFHLQARDGPEGPVLLDLVNRTGGARIAETFQLATGIHLPSAELSLRADVGFELQPRLVTRYRYAWFLFPGHRLRRRYCRVRGHEFLRDRAELLSLSELPPDVALTDHVTYLKNEVPLAGLLRGESSQALIALVTDAFARIEVHDCDEPVYAEVGELAV